MSTQTQHTPGPWGIVYPGPDRDKKRGRLPMIRIEGALDNNVGGALVCEVNDGWGDDVANARLIAAAPELLEALRKAASVLEHSLTDAERRDMANEARAVIAKATGGVS